jgi:hypothetical protein
MQQDMGMLQDKEKLDPDTFDEMKRQAVIIVIPVMSRRRYSRLRHLI